MDIDMSADMNMLANIDPPTSAPPPQPQVQPQQVAEDPQSMDLTPSSSALPPADTQPHNFSRDKFREVSVKVHVRKPGHDTWSYVGRAVVSQEMFGQGNRIVVRALTSTKVITAFNEGAPLQAEKRGNFVVVSCVEGGRVVSWSLNALNNSETLRLLAIIELSCYSCKHSHANPELHNHQLRRIARVIKDDRRKRHKRRKDQDAMVDAFAKTGLSGGDGDVPQ